MYLQCRSCISRVIKGQTNIILISFYILEVQAHTGGIKNVKSQVWTEREGDYYISLE